MLRTSRAGFYRVLKDAPNRRSFLPPVEASSWIGFAGNPFLGASVDCLHDYPTAGE
jgi:hypothetical protein